MTPPGQSELSFEPAALRRLLDGEHAAVRQRVCAILSRPSFRYLPLTASIEEQRRAAYRWCRELAHEGIGLLAIPTKYGGQDDFAAFMAAFETVAFHDLSATIKFTVQFGIWLGSVLLLGNEAQHRAYLHRIGTFELPGCFAMTEIGHGSNVRELETTATYDPATEEFVVHSPTWESGKNYIGNGACDGRLATVFAQLETGGARQGVHAFLVPLRTDEGRVCPGVRIEDNGPKMGENGVDNARLWFDRVRIPRTALLERFGQVTADGTYQSAIPGAAARFFATISALVGGRISIAAAALSAAKSGLAIAVRYAARRRQFRAPGAAHDTALLDYPTHQRRLLPLLANAYALDFAHKGLVRRRVETQDGHDPAGTREVELLAAGLKAYLTWNTTRTLQTCRECCGGEGYMSVNRLPALKADSDIFTTFEGDNTVLMLWIGRQLLADAARAAGAGDPDLGGLDTPEDDRALHRQLFGARQHSQIEAIRLDLQRLSDRGLSAHAAANRQQTRLLSAAQAYVERVILASFDALLATAAAAPAHALLTTLRDLFALTLIDQHKGWYLENGLLPTWKSPTITAASTIRPSSSASSSSASSIGRAPRACGEVISISSAQGCAPASGARAPGSTCTASSSPEREISSNASTAPPVRALARARRSSALSTLSSPTKATAREAGRGNSLNAAAVTIPSVPSAPIIRPRRS